jgi:hypothetical protein
VLLGAESEGVHVDTSAGSAAVVLVGLDAVKVRSLTLRETILTVELELGNLHGVLALAAHTRVKDNLGEEVVDTRLELTSTGKINGVSSEPLGVGANGRVLTKNSRRSRGIASTRNVLADTRVSLGEEGSDDTIRAEVIGVVEGLGTTNRREPGGGRAVHERVTLNNPEELLHGVVEVELDLVGRRSDGLRTSVLHLLNEVLVALLGKAAALLGVEVDVVNIEGSSSQGLSSHGSGNTSGGLRILAVLPGLKVNVDTNLVVLEGDEGNSKTRVAAEPELEGDVEGLGRGTSAGNAGDGSLRRRAGSIKSNAVTALEEHEVMGVTNEGVKSGNRAGLRGELGPDLHPVTILAINTLTTNLNLNLLDEAVTNVVEPAETRSRTSVTSNTTSTELDLGEHNLNVGLVHQISITINHSSDTLVEVSLSVEGNLNRLHGEVGVALVENLPESNLRVARDINILSTVRNELH